MRRNFTCFKCGRVESVPGGQARFVCSRCKPADHFTLQPKYLAHKAVAKARRLGLLPDPKTLVCDDCGGAATEYDHRDYDKPLSVDPVCRGCNARRGPALQQVSKSTQSGGVSGFKHDADLLAHQ